MENVLLGFILTLFAGLATTVGGFITIFMKKTNKKSLSFFLGLSAGVMIYISFMEILPEALNLFSERKEPIYQLYGILFFFLGALIMGIIDKLVPEKENPHHIRTLEEDCKGNGKGLGKRRRRQNNHECDRRLSKIGFMTAIAIAIHNFPEGIVTFFSTVQSPHLGIILAISIAIHNIPEGISISVPIYHATNDKMKSIRAAFFSGLTEPLGALLGYIILSSFFNDTIMGIILAIVAGIMVYISLDELLPTAREYGEPHIALYGLFSGMFIMAVSLVLFQI